MGEHSPGNPMRFPGEFVSAVARGTRCGSGRPLLPEHLLRPPEAVEEVADFIARGPAYQAQMLRNGTAVPEPDHVGGRDVQNHRSGIDPPERAPQTSGIRRVRLLRPGERNAGHSGRRTGGTPRSSDGIGGVAAAAGVIRLAGTVLFGGVIRSGSRSREKDIEFVYDKIGNYRVRHHNISKFGGHKSHCAPIKK